MSCNFHLKACQECGKCPRHDCAHDGIPISAKKNRKRGRQPGPLKNAALKRRTSTKKNYSEESMQELLSRPLAECVMKNGNAVAKPCEKVSDIAKTLSLGSSFISHFPSLEMRTNEADLTSIERHTSMMSFATRCEIVYPANPEALKDAVLN